MGGKRARNGRKLVNPRTNATSARRKEQAEIDRLSKATIEIPRYSSRFQIFRQNRRQRKKQVEIDKANASEQSPGQPEHPMFRASKFTDLPLSKRTLDGLAASGFTELTGIQKTAIPQALAGRDVLAAAPTGSGKTLAFLVPMLEILWRNKWNTLDGLGALIISPTRELSMQIFEVLRTIGRKHTISAGLVIGGKDFEAEKLKVGQMNVLVATPGRLLHHMDHVAELDCSNLKVLILDEADRILDMGFSKSLDAILANLPNKRQTMLFSATQTRDVKSLARLSLREPEYVAVHSRPSEKGDEEEDEEQKGETKASGGHGDSIRLVGTPVGLVQSYAVVGVHEKLSVLWSFIKTHLKSKMIIFFASSKQVRFAFEMFCKLRPGMSLLHIHGHMKQLRRTDMYDVFCRTKSAALFATDVASRGLDFPDVEWVIQVDCPDDVGTYVHRVGRTARFRSNGKAMLLLNEGKEETFLERLKAKNLELTRSKINPGKLTSVDPRVAEVIASNQELRQLAQRAFMFYIKSVYQQSDKGVFDVTSLDFEKLAKSFGLSGVPKVSFKGGAKGGNAVREAKEREKTVFGYSVRESRQKAVAGDDAEGSEGSDEEELLTVRRTLGGKDGDSGEDEEEEIQLPKPARQKRKKRKLDLLGGLPSANRIVFTEDGRSVRAGDIVGETSDDGEEETEHDNVEAYAATVAKKLASTADEDKEREHERVRAMHTKRRIKARDRNKVLRPNAEMEVVVGDMMEDEEVDQSDDGSGNDSDNDNGSGSEGSATGEEDKERVKEAEERALRILERRR